MIFPFQSQRTMGNGNSRSISQLPPKIEILHKIGNDVGDDVRWLFLVTQIIRTSNQILNLGCFPFFHLERIINYFYQHRFESYIRNNFWSILTQYEYWINRKRWANKNRPSLIKINKLKYFKILYVHNLSEKNTLMLKENLILKFINPVVLAKHIKGNEHTSDFTNTAMLNAQFNLNKRLISEMIHIWNKKKRILEDIQNVILCYIFIM